MDFFGFLVSFFRLLVLSAFEVTFPGCIFKIDQKSTVKSQKSQKSKTTKFKKELEPESLLSLVVDEGQAVARARLTAKVGIRGAKKKRELDDPTQG